MNLQNLDWALWRSFLAILREGSLSAAARALDVAHPTVRRHLDELADHHIRPPVKIESVTKSPPNLNRPAVIRP
jgi:predicted ArsR family transcriptional regulator